MKNFPSTLIRQQNTKNGLGNTLSDTFKNIGTQVASSLFSNGENASSKKNMMSKFEIGYTRPELAQMLNEVNILEETQEISDLMYNNANTNADFLYNFQNGNGSISDIHLEDPFNFSSSIFSVINNYKYVFNYTVPSINKMEAMDTKGNYVMSMPHSIVSPSLFNPYVGINITGITENIPLTNIDHKSINKKDIESGLDDSDEKLNKDVKMTFESSIYGTGQDKDISDCSIRTLVKLSQDNKLGSETYRYQDFMYCKDLGKIPNNRLITLRRFPAPVGDNIYDDKICGITDIGRLITWFDNEDNKLENICKYSYRASWKEFTANIDYKDSEDQDEGLVGHLANFLSPKNNKLVGEGFSGNYGFMQNLATGLNIPIIGDSNAAKKQYYDTITLKNYDQHKIYEPANRISKMFKYDGDLEFNQEITLVFRYVLRSYDNINPRAAMMDLLGNIMTVTYTRGKFWGGENNIIGGANRSVYETADNLIDEGFNYIGGVFSMLKEGSFNFESLKSWFSNMLDQGKVLLDKAKNKAEGMTGINDNDSTDTKVKKVTHTVVDQIQKLNEKYGWGNAIKGMLKNQLGRPAIYAFNSLLTGEDNGLWHLTIGNPRNPIMSIGNLIIDSPAEIQHYGPLGLDDFPTEMSVTVTLKPQRARDRVDIEKMYTKGRSGIYQPMNLIDIKKYYSSVAFGDLITIKNPDKTLRINLGNI